MGIGVGRVSCRLLVRLQRPRFVLVCVLVAFAIAALTVLLRTPAWEANDEPDHVRNIESLVRGEWYRVDPTVGAETYQAPAYYLLVAGWQRLWGSPAREAHPIAPRRSLLRPTSTRHGVYLHPTEQERHDKGFVNLLRLPSVLLGLLTIYLTYRAGADCDDGPVDARCRRGRCRLGTAVRLPLRGREQRQSRVDAGRGRDPAQPATGHGRPGAIREIACCSPRQSGSRLV